MLFKNQYKRFSKHINKIHIIIGISAVIPAILAFYFGVNKNFPELVQKISVTIIIYIILLSIITVLIILCIKYKKLYREALNPLFEGAPAQSLIVHQAHRAKQKIINPVRLDLFEINVRIIGRAEGRKDADVTYYFEGTNLSNETLHELNLTIAGDNNVSLDDLNCRVYDCTKAEDCENILPDRPFLLKDSPDNLFKDISLQFLHPGIEEHGSFKLKFEFLWPGIFSIKEDFWFLDNIGFQGETKKIKLSIEFITMEVEKIKAFEWQSGSLYKSIGVPKREGKNKYYIEQNSPTRDAYYIIFFTGKTGKTKQAVNGNFSISSGTKRHSRENGNPENPKKHWIPAFARMTIKIFKKLPEVIEKLLLM